MYIMKAKRNKIKNLKKMNKKPSYAKMFLSRFAIILVTGFILLSIAMSVFTDYIILSLESGISLLEGRVVENVVKKYYENYKENGNPFKEPDFKNNLYTAFFPFGERNVKWYHALLDEGGRIVLESTDKLCVILKSENNNKALLSCERPQIENLFLDYVKFNENLQDNEGLVIKIYDIFVAGYNFIPGKVEIIKENNDNNFEKNIDVNGKSYRCLKQYDFTPENIQEYEHICGEGEYEIGNAFIGMTYFTEEELDDLKKEIFHDYDKLYNYTDIVNNFGIIDCVNMLNTRKITLDEKTYYTVAFQKSNIREQYKTGIEAGVLVWALLGLLVATVSSRIKYLKKKAKYDMENYRRTMTNAMAHDLKSPLMVISGYAENLKENPDIEKRSHYIDAISNNVEYMNEIISNILELSRVEQGNIIVNLNEINIRDTLQSVISKYELLLADKTMNININGECNILSDDKIMKQVCDNIIGNAVKYGKENSDITVKLSDKRITVENYYANIINTTPDELVLPFVRGDNSRTEKKGTGVGLAICKHLLEIQGFKMHISIKNNIFSVEITG